MVKTVSKLFRKLIRVISDKTVPKSVRSHLLLEL
jgi:uncharacterized protein (UPF0147 family)